MKILVINPGSTSTKIAVFEDLKPIYSTNIHHAKEDLGQFNDINDQYEFRKNLILDKLHQEHIAIDFDAIVSRGGLGKPVEGGAMIIDEQMIIDNMATHHKHVCNLASKMAFHLAAQIPGCQALTADPGVVDELIPEARITGLPEIQRECFWHALNQKAVARRYAAEQGKRYEDYNLIVCHLGGGVSVAAHQRGKAIDVNNALDGEGPFSTERTGSLPSSDLVRLCFSGKYTEQKLLRLITGEGGLTAHLGTNDLRVAMELADNGDTHAQLLIKAMAFNIAKAISAEAAVLYGNIDAILITGGMAHATRFVEMITERIRFLAPIHCYPGEDEMTALAEVGYAVLTGKVQARVYA